MKISIKMTTVVIAIKDKNNLIKAVKNLSIIIIIIIRESRFIALS